MLKKILGIVVLLFLMQLLTYHLFSRSLLIARVMEDQEFALIYHPDSIYLTFCNIGEAPSVDTTDYMNDSGELIEFEKVSHIATLNTFVEADTSDVLLEEEPADDVSVPPTHILNYSEIPSLSRKERLQIEKHFQSKSNYVHFALDDEDYLNSGVSKYFVYKLCLDTDFFVGRVEEALVGHAPDIGYYEGWNSTYLWVLFTWVKLDRHVTGQS